MTRIGYLSTYPPTRCGLATFTRALSSAMEALGTAPSVIVRVLDDEEEHAPPAPAARIASVVRAGDRRSHIGAARVLDGCDAVIVQHEYGIYGGPDGDEVLDILALLNCPVITVLHTVLATPTPNQRRVLEAVVRASSVTVVMTEHSLDTLVRCYAVDDARLRVIPHGVARAGAHGLHRRGEVARLLTWGLLSPGKGIERGIRALALLRNMGVDAEYVIAGQTHPKVRARSGEAYRDSLMGLTRALGLQASVRFVDGYLDDDELGALLASADVALLPYDSRDQATSGVLVEAVAAGVPVVATAFPHAMELLAGGAGIVVPHDEPAAMVDAIESILGVDDASARMQRAGMRDGNALSWPQVAAQYSGIIRRLAAEQAA